MDSTEAATAHSPLLPAWAPRHRFDVVDYRRIGEAGILRREQRVKLIEGEIIEMSRSAGVNS